MKGKKLISMGPTENTLRIEWKIKILQRNTELRVTTKEADTKAKTATSAEAKGGTKLPKSLGFHNRQLPQQTLIIAYIPLVSLTPPHSLRLLTRSVWFDVLLQDSINFLLEFEPGS